MFDFFKDVANEVWGVDPPREPMEIPKNEKHIFSKGVKRLVITLGIIYILMAGSTVGILLSMHDIWEVFLPVAYYIALIGISVFTIIMLLFGKKRGEQLARWSCVVFVVLLLLSMYIM